MQFAVWRNVKLNLSNVAAAVTSQMNGLLTFGTTIEQATETMPLALKTFTSDGVGVLIRSVEQYDLLKIKPMESEAEHLFCF